MLFLQILIGTMKIKPGVGHYGWYIWVVVYWKLEEYVKCWEED